jgi:hypothetical protein
VNAFNNHQGQSLPNHPKVPGSENQPDTEVYLSKNKALLNDNEYWITTRLTTNTSKSFDKLGPLLRAVSNDLKGGTKSFVLVGKPLQQRHALNKLKFYSSLVKDDL